MDSLNFPDAMKLARILNKYISVGSVEESPDDFITGILGKIEPLDFLNCIRLISDREITEKTSGEELRNLFYTSMMDNKILSLVSTYHKIGFT